MPSSRVRIAVVVAVLAIGGYLAFAPSHQPAPKRPVLTFVGRLAKLFLWTVALEEPPQEQAIQGSHTVSLMTDEHGNRVLANREGW